MKTRLAVLAREHTWAAFDTLVDICQNGQSERARIAAACALLDRGFGRPREAGLNQYNAPSIFDE